MGQNRLPCANRILGEFPAEARDLRSGFGDGFFGNGLLDGRLLDDRLLYGHFAGFQHLPDSSKSVPESEFHELHSGLAERVDVSQYRLVAPRPATYRLRTLRIGFKPLLTEPVALGASVRASLALYEAFGFSLPFTTAGVVAGMVERIARFE